MAKKLHLRWHSYKYFPYERSLAKREVRALLSPNNIREESDGLSIQGNLALDRAKQLTYFSSVTSAKGTYATVQARLEQGSLNGNGVKRQATRYSVHGLHEYKGKFNPQIVRYLLNAYCADRRFLVMDPFCGSGTTLVECAHIGLRSVGLDLNPLAVYTANAKLLALSASSSSLWDMWHRIEQRLKVDIFSKQVDRDAESNAYLARWIDPESLSLFDRLYNSICETTGGMAPIFLTLVSNRIRDYSLQDPMDLRIRKRRSPLPTAKIFDVFSSDVKSMLMKLESAQKELSDVRIRSEAFSGDARRLGKTGANPKAIYRKYGLFVTSPPYATALPYIDTQRLSLVWLSLCTVSGLHQYEASLIGSREFRGKSNKMKATNELMNNFSELPEQSARFCRKLQKNIGPNDGFRRKAVPSLLYRYFAGMRDVFAGLKTLANHGAHFALVVGTNHTVLNGELIVIDTPKHLVSLGAQCGWQPVESIPLETYQRYGLHHKNAVKKESLIVLRNI